MWIKPLAKSVSGQSLVEGLIEIDWCVRRTASYAMVIVPEIFLEVGNIDDFAFLEVGILVACCEAFWI